MDIRKYPAAAGNIGSTRAAGAIKYIVIHYTGNDGDTAMNNAKYYASNVVKTSAHYFVDEKEVVQSVDDLRIDRRRDDVRQVQERQQHQH